MTSQEAIKRIEEFGLHHAIKDMPHSARTVEAFEMAIKALSAQSEQTKMIKEIREWINSGNRGSADYFIVDKIEEIINKYE